MHWERRATRFTVDVNAERPRRRGLELHQGLDITMRWIRVANPDAAKQRLGGELVPSGLAQEIYEAVGRQQERDDRQNQPPEKIRPDVLAE
jgi:hypothetical protein